jgi:carboxyl-terminal processing protease
LNKTLKYIFVVLVVIVVALGSFAGGFVSGHYFSFTNIPGLSAPVTVAPPTTSPEEQSATPSEFQALFAPFWEAWNLVHQNYVDQPVDQRNDERPR